MRYLFLLLLLLGLPWSLRAQEKITVQGTIYDKENDVTLPGVTILTGEPLTPISVSDENGKFRVRVQADAELTFRFLGFNDVRVKVKGRTTISVTMAMSQNALKEVVVIGYQKKSRETATGASVSISGEEIQDVPVANITELLQGKVAGLNIQNNTGAPGARGSIFMRGLSSIGVVGSGNDAFLTPTSPLFVIDGVPVDLNTNYQYGFNQAGPGVSPLSLIPPEDVEKIDVLKDAQATSLYGSRGAYGVILITTKRGQSKVPVIQYSAKFFANVPPKLKQVLGGQDERSTRIWEIMNNDTSMYSGRDKINREPFLSDSLNPFFNNSTNWQQEFFKPTFNHSHNISALGGDQKFNYKANLGYYNEKGIIKNTGFNRYSLSMNTEYRPTTKFRLYTAVAASVAENKKGSGNGITQTGVANAASASSLLPPPSLFTASNAALSAFAIANDNKTANLRTNLDLQYELFKGLRLSTSFSYNYTSSKEDNFKPAITNNNLSQAYAFHERKSKLYSRNTINYVKSINEVHNFNLFVFNEIISEKYQSEIILQQGTSNDQYQGPFGYGQDGSYGGVYEYGDRRSVGFAGAFSYNYKKKYVFDFSYRMDGTSANGPDMPYTQNPSIGVRWNFNKEPWLENLYWLDYGSIRGSWGKNIVPTGSIFDAYGTYDFHGNFNNSPSVGIEYGTLPNTRLSPTVTTQLNGGFEAGFFKGKFSTIFDVYYKQVDNLLQSKLLTSHNAFSNIRSNETSLVNYGYELTLALRPLAETSPFNWRISFTGAINKDVLTHLPDGVRQIRLKDDATNQDILYRIGRNSLSNILYHNKGVYSNSSDVPVDPATGEPYRTGSGANEVYFQGGDPIWTDINGDYRLDDRDLVVAGNSQPSITGGINSYLQYKKFTLNANISYTLDRDILNNALAARFQYFSNPSAQNNLIPIDQYNYWNTEGDVAVYPNPYDYLRYGFYRPFRYNQTLFQEDGSYWKINNITLGYTFDRERISHLGISSMRVYFTANNVYTFSSYSGPDPENVTALGRDRSDGYPSRRSYSIGVNVQF